MKYQGLQHKYNFQLFWLVKVLAIHKSIHLQDRNKQTVFPPAQEHFKYTSTINTILVPGNYF